MFKIRIVAEDSKGKNPFVQTVDYRGADPDLRVREIVRSLLFTHGYERIRITVLRVSSQVLKTDKTIVISLINERRR